MIHSQIVVFELGVHFFRPRKSRVTTQGKDLVKSGVKIMRKEWAIQGVSFSVEKGETVAILGRNGAGKTTLMRILEGSLLPDQGSFRSDTKPVSMSSLMTGFHGHSTVLGNLKSLGRLRGIRQSDLTEFAVEVINFAGLEEKMHHKYKTLSTGMKARLGFSFAHIFDPEILLIDEGFANGDRWFLEKSQKAMSRYLASGKTVIMTSHSEKLLKDTCSRGILLRRGQVAFDGSIQEALKNYHAEGSRD
jgi:ABC-type polysaccharide/polyol phosphate transport system ATPase subunit